MGWGGGARHGRPTASRHPSSDPRPCSARNAARLGRPWREEVAEERGGGGGRAEAAAWGLIESCRCGTDFQAGGAVRRKARGRGRWNPPREMNQLHRKGRGGCRGQGVYISSRQEKAAPSAVPLQLVQTSPTPGELGAEAAPAKSLAKAHRSVPKHVVCISS